LIRIIFAPLFVSWMTIGLSWRMRVHPTGARLRLPGYMGVTGNGQFFDGDACSGASACVQPNVPHVCDVGHTRAATAVCRNDECRARAQRIMLR